MFHGYWGSSCVLVSSDYNKTPSLSVHFIEMSRYSTSAELTMRNKRVMHVLVVYGVLFKRTLTKPGISSGMMTPQDNTSLIDTAVKRW